MFPEKVNIYEVGPRDGLQNERLIMPLKSKVKFIDMLSNCNFKNIEIGSFVSPKWIPQMENSAELIKLIKKNPNTSYPYLIPNYHGLLEAIKNQVKIICVFTTASEIFSKKNTNCSVKESLLRIEKVVLLAKKKGLKVRGYISCVLGCPYEGEVEFDKTVELAKFLNDIGCYEISLGDTVGYGTPLKVKSLIEKVLRHVEVEKIAIHFHDTYGQALANILASLQLGISNIDASVGGLGGCPFANGAKGNVASEDVIYMLNGMNIKNNIDLKRLVKASWFVHNALNKKPSSRVALAIGNKGNS